MSCGGSIHSSQHFRNVVLVHISIVRSDRKTFSLHERTGNSIHYVVQLPFCHVEPGQKLGSHLPAQSMRSSNIKSVTAGVNNRIDAHAAPNILEIAPA